MTRHDDSVSLRHMLDHAREAVNLILGDREKRSLTTERWNLRRRGSSR